MSSINSGINSPINVSPPNGGVLPKGKVNDPMPTSKDDGPHFTPGPDGELPGKPGAEKPSKFVAGSGVHAELNGLFEGRPDGPGCIIPGSGLPPEKQFAVAKDRLLNELKTQQAEVKPAMAKLKKIIAISKNPAEVKEAKAMIASYVAKEKCLAGVLSLVNNFKFPPGDGFSNNGQLTYVAGVFEMMEYRLRSSTVKNGDLLNFKSKLADLPPVDPRIAPPPIHTMAMNEGGWMPKPDFPPPLEFATTQAIPEGGWVPKPLEPNPQGERDLRLENGGCWDPRVKQSPVSSHIDQVLPHAPNPERNVQLGKARELLRGGHVPYSTQSDAQIRWTLGHKRRNEWTAEDYAACLKINEKPRTAVDDSINPVLYPGHNIRRSVSADTTLAMPFMIPEGGIAMNIMVALTTGVAPSDGSTMVNLPDWCISTTPGDFTENVVPNGTSIGNGGRLDVNTPPLPPTDLGNALTTNSIILEPGKTYYLNFRSKSPDEGTGFVLQTHSNVTSAYKGTPTVSGLPGFLNGVDLNLGKQLEYPSLRNF